MTEHWKPVVGFEGWYSVSDRGKVRRDRAGPHTCVGKLLKGVPDDGGYLKVGLYAGGKRESTRIHTLVARAFIGVYPLGYEVHHEDDVKANNVLSNLSYMTKCEHEKTRVPACGEKHGMAKLTEALVRTIRDRHADGMLQVEIAKLFNVSQQQVSAIVRRARWKHVA